MQKEILTREKIVKDLKEILIKEIPYLLLYIPFILLADFLVTTSISLFVDLTYQFKLVFSIIFYAAFFSWLIWDFFKIIIALLSINKFKIANDYVVEKLPKHLGGKFAHSRPYTLIFAHNGKYYIPNRMNYKWSNLFAMWDENVYHSTDLNDDFYLVSIGKRKNIFAYNKKFFDFNE